MACNDDRGAAYGRHRWGKVGSNRVCLVCDAVESIAHQTAVCSAARRFCGCATCELETRLKVGVVRCPRALRVADAICEIR